MLRTTALATLAALVAAPAFAEEGGPTLAANVALSSDYLFRGVSQTDNAPAISGGFDFAAGSFYAGTWASNVDFSDLGILNGALELDAYAGFKPTLGPVALDLGIVGYFYPGADAFNDVGGEGKLDYVEGYVKASTTLGEAFTVGGAFYYSPEFTGKTGEAYYAELNAAATLSDSVAISGAVGMQSIGDVAGVFSNTDVEDEYVTYNLGATYSALGCSFDLRYIGSDIETTDDILVNVFTTEDRVSDRAVLTVKKAF